MENRKKETIKFALGIDLVLDNNGKIKPKLIAKNINMPNDIIINQLRLFVKMLEENYYPNFKGSTTVVDLWPSE